MYTFKRYLFFSLLLTISAVASAAPIDEATAQKKAAEFLNKQVRTHVGGQHRAPGNVSLTKAAATDLYYVYNAGAANGFVMVAADDRLPEVIAYADKGSFTTEKMPAHIKAWLDEYDNQAKWLREHQAQAAPNKAGEPADPTVHDRWEAISPLIETRWGQDYPYNAACPTALYEGNEYPNPTGCVATAMAQVMNFYQWPKGETTEIPGYYMDGFTLLANYHTESDPKEPTTFDWDNMITDYRNLQYTDAQVDAVANLMAYAGAGVRMDYYPSVSNAVSAAIAPALKRYFGYDAATAYLQRSDYKAATWNAIVYNELKAGRPVIYCGQSTGGGHCFVIDGYDGNGLYHVNWGWDGECDGYYLLDILNPYDTGLTGASSSSDGYSFVQDITIVVPGDGTPQDINDGPLRLHTSGLYIAENGRFDEDMISGMVLITDNIYNRSIEEADFRLSVGVEDPDGNLRLASNVKIRLPYKGEWVNANDYLNDLYPGQGIYGSTFTCDVTGLTRDGIYKVYPVSHAVGDSKWYMCGGMGDSYAEVTIADGELVSIVRKPLIALKTTKFVFEGTNLATDQMTATVTIANNSDDEYNDNLYVFASSSTSDKGYCLGITGAYIPSGESRDITFYFTPYDVGRNRVWITSDIDGNNVIGSGVVTLSNKIKGTGSIRMDKLELNTDGSIVYGNTLKVKATITNTSPYETYNRQIAADIIYDFDLLIDEVRQPLYLKPGETKVVEWEIKDVPYGETFELFIFYYYWYGESTYSTFFDEFTNFTCIPSVRTWDYDGTANFRRADVEFYVPDDVTAVSLRDVDRVETIVPNENPNTVYYLNAGQTVKGLPADANIVVNGKAENVNIFDGYDYYIPENIKVDNVTYHRQINSAVAEGQTGGWETLVVPFKPTAITTEEDGTTVAFMANADDTSSASQPKVSVKQFDTNDNNIALFDYVDGIESNLPYIISAPEAANLAGKTLIFKTTDTKLKAQNEHGIHNEELAFRGLEVGGERNNVYVLNNEGNAFVKTATADIPSFRAFFSCHDESLLSKYDVIYIDTDAITNGIKVLDAETDHAGSAAIYDIQGRQISNLASPAKGIYIVNGKKKVIK